MRFVIILCLAVQACWMAKEPQANCAVEICKERLRACEREKVDSEERELEWRDDARRALRAKQRRENSDFQE